MKVVMLTFEYCSAIDRRIILEAESLSRAGIEVKIIALSENALQDTVKHNGMFIEPVHLTFDSKNADFLLKAYFRYFKKFLAKFPTLVPKMRAAYFFWKNAFHKKLQNNPFQLLPNARAFFDIAVKEKADIYFAHDLPMLPIACEAGKETKAKIVYDSHEFWTGLSELSRLEARIYKKIESIFIQKVDIAITVNDFIADLFLKTYGLRPEVIMNCVDWEVKSIYTNPLREKLKLSKEMKILLYQGGFLQFRNLELLVKSSEKFADGIVLIMLGNGILKKKLLNIAKRKNVLDRKVFFLDPVPYNELYSYTASADAGIIPYHTIDINTLYCTPNKLFEYLSAGIPIISNDLPAVKQIVEGEGIGVCVSMEKENLLAEAVNKFLPDQNRLEICRKNLISIHQKYSWSKQGKKLIDIISRLN